MVTNCLWVTTSVRPGPLAWGIMITSVFLRPLCGQRYDALQLLFHNNEMGPFHKSLTPRAGTIITELVIATVVRGAISNTTGYP